MGPDANHPTDAGEDEALFQSTDQHNPLVQRREPVAVCLECLLELPTKLRDGRIHLDTVDRIELVDDALAEGRQAEPRTGKAYWFGRGRRRLAERRGGQRDDEKPCTEAVAESVENHVVTS